MALDPISYTLPSGRTITMRLPLVADRERVTRRLLEEYRDDPRGPTRAILERDALLMAEMLTSDSGHKGGGLDPDAKHRLGEWDLADMQAYQAFYNELVSLSAEEEDAAKAAAKSIRAARYARAGGGA